MMFNKLELVISNELKTIWKKYKTTVIVAFIIIPFLIQIFLKLFNLISSLNGWDISLSFSSSWLGFWGSYLGIIPSGLIAWSVASKQIQSDRENSKIQHIESMYLDDLRQIQKILLLHNFSGQWQFPYNGPLKGSLTSPEIKMFRMTFLNISGEGDQEIIKTDKLFDVKTIVQGLPLSKRKRIQPTVDKMCDEILTLASYKPSEFQNMEERYSATSLHKNDDDIHMKQFEAANKDWKDNSDLFWSHIEIITIKFNELLTFVNDELSIYYKL
ncbi:hypothetical protein [Leuconostoc sp. C2]|uniref:hypothetical protein n=1 Tax=Leuconostoc sp. (strain C2) TaxID=979982 RepID=UPI0002174210|nr:hypothetical protein [Leuconostoc sp. C2]AEJ31438.1 hypothetical protein LGMK_06940 [Leuconostoc sp. C2]